MKSYSSTPFQVESLLKTHMLQIIVVFVSGFQYVGSLVLVGWKSKSLINSRLLVVTNSLTMKGCKMPFWKS